MLAKYMLANQYTNRTHFTTVLGLSEQFDLDDVNSNSRRLLGLFNPSKNGNDSTIFHFISGKRDRARAFLSQHDREEGSTFIMGDESDDEMLLTHHTNPHNKKGDNAGADEDGKDHHKEEEEMDDDNVDVDNHEHAEESEDEDEAKDADDDDEVYGDEHGRAPGDTADNPLEIGSMGSCVGGFKKRKRSVFMDLTLLTDSDNASDPHSADDDPADEFE